MTDEATSDEKSRSQRPARGLIGMRASMAALLSVVAMLVSVPPDPAAASTHDPLAITVDLCGGTYYVSIPSEHVDPVTMQVTYPVAVRVHRTTDTPAPGDPQLHPRTTSVLVRYDHDGDGSYDSYVAAQVCPVTVTPRTRNGEPREFDWDRITDTSPTTQAQHNDYYDDVAREWNAGIADCDAHQAGTQTDCKIKSRHSSTIAKYPNGDCYDGNPATCTYHYVDCGQYGQVPGDGWRTSPTASNPLPGENSMCVD